MDNVLKRRRRRKIQKIGGESGGVAGDERRSCRGGRGGHKEDGLACEGQGGEGDVCGGKRGR